MGKNLQSTVESCHVHTCPKISIGGNSQQFGGVKVNQNYQNGSSGPKKGGNKKQPCWKFNKNLPCSPKCDFDHKCSYCGVFGHSVINCEKLAAKKAELAAAGAHGANQAK